MVEDEAAIEVEEEILDAPERREADELMDHGAAGDELGPMRHSAAHVLAEAVLDLFPGTKLGIGPVIADGFYYDFLLPRPLTPEDLPAIEERMRESIAADHPFEFSEETPEAARAALVERDQPFKVEIIDDLLAAAERDGTPMPPTTFYRQGPFIDLCRGPHVASTGKIGPFKLLGTAGAYWRGDEKRPMLQRVYGTAWATQEELDLYLERRAEAKKRDHRRLGVALDLYSFHDVSPGSAFWHPKGQRIWRTLETAMRELQERRGYQEVSTPIVVSEKLWRKSGHWDLLPGQHVPDRVREPDLQPQADELPGVDIHLPIEAALVPRPAAPLQRVRAVAPKRTIGHVVRPDPRPPVHPGRCPPLRPTRSADRRDRGAARRGPRVVRLVRPVPGSASRRSPTRRSAIPRCGSAPSS